MIADPSYLLQYVVLLSAAFAAWLSISCYRIDRTDVGRSAGIVAFVALGTFFTIVAGRLTFARRWDLLHYLVAAAGGTLVSVRTVRLLVDRWHRTVQAVLVVGTMLAVLLPFELFPEAMIGLQAAWATHLTTVVEPLGVPAAVTTMPSGLPIRITVGDSRYIDIVRECTGIDAIALFGGMIVAARTTRRRKLGAAAFMVVAVYVVNVLRLTFVSAALAGDWFGPLLTDENTIDVTFFVAEVLIGQAFVVTASVAGVLLVGRWIPDVVGFATELLGGHQPT